MPLRLIERHALAPGVLHLAFIHADGAALPFHAGQFIQVFFRAADGSEQRRSFSLANPPAAETMPGRWELAVSLLPDGAASRWLQDVPLETVVDAAGPFGRFRLFPEDTPRRLLLLATGTGIAPMRAMVPELCRRAQAGAEVILVSGARERAGLLYLEEFRERARITPGLRFIGCLSREPVSEDEPDLVSGHVQDVLAGLAPQPGDLFLLCGNPAMVDDCTLRLQAAGLGLRAIRRERYIASG